MLSTAACRSRVLRVVGQRQRERDRGLRAPGRPHLRQNVEKSRHERRHLEQPADETSDVTAVRWYLGVAAELGQIQLSTMLKTVPQQRLISRNSWFIDRHLPVAVT